MLLLAAHVTPRLESVNDARDFSSFCHDAALLWEFLSGVQLSTSCSHDSEMSCHVISTHLIASHLASIAACKVVEPLVSRQWFVRMQPLAEPALAAVKEGRLKIVPQRFEKVRHACALQLCVTEARVEATLRCSIKSVAGHSMVPGECEWATTG